MAVLSAGRSGEKTMKDELRLKPLTEALGDHSAEGIAIPTSEPWRFIQLAARERR